MAAPFAEAAVDELLLDDELDDADLEAVAGLEPPALRIVDGGQGVGALLDVIPDGGGAEGGGGVGGGGDLQRVGLVHPELRRRLVRVADLDRQVRERAADVARADERDLVALEVRAEAIAILVTGWALDKRDPRLRYFDRIVRKPVVTASPLTTVLGAEDPD